MRKALIFCLFLVTSITMSAQHRASRKYHVWFEDTPNELYTRNMVNCQEEGQELWNGCWVRVRNGYIYIYNGDEKILYGDEVSLFYNGYYRVKRAGNYYLFTAEGEKVNGVFGEDIRYYPWNYFAVKKGSGFWYVYHADGTRLSFFSEAEPLICYNGCWIYQRGNTQYAADQKGDKISGVYGDEVSLMNSGRWKCIRNGQVFIKDGN